MKRIIIYITGLSLFTACDSYLDTVPTDRFTQETYWNSKEKIEAALIGSYSVLNNANSFFAAPNMVYLDALTPNTYQYNGDWNLISRGLHDANTGKFNSTWNQCYEGIGRVNNILANIDKVELQSKDKERYIAEAKFLRALFYFPLWNLYGGAPLITEAPDLESQRDLGRSSEEDLLKQILSDLNDASKEGVLAKSYSGLEKGRATIGAVLSFKARVLLYAGQWNEAAITAKKVIELNEYELFPDYRGLFLLENEGNKEVIFDIQYAYPEFAHSLDVSLDQQLGSSPLPELIDAYYAIDGKPISKSSLYDKTSPYKNRDSRLHATVVLPGSIFKGSVVATNQYPSTGAGLKKYTIYKDLEKPLAVQTSGTSELNYIVLRYADVLLTYAEAQNEIAGPSDDIFNALDKIRDRVGMARINRDLNKDELRKEIRHERRVEFAGEGLYYFDIRRWKIASQVLNTEIYHLNGNRIDSRAFRENRDYLWPIPSLAIQNNDQLIQNPNYGN
ncbi:RagB/SusD family nutrient uptake outer membrane protein [Sphingobacterium daejeonense]|uniref:RagB/SusD family nutrient uptake outer membrane protein n=1 Tax=Sphingobacterium daejeonense TaxID=371142 RepID=UPI0010C263DC|nr:RagB/SusD family nutrient uptake outer membrane protein [Sphingobacterium daejeonense]VTQ04531.1 SusD family [Sphingobacterium daejeonense]